MITKWKVFNFKSIREETELDLGPLTIFAGANSSGKSTFIQSVLLVAQTLSHKVGSRSVVLNGALTSLGQFSDLKSSGGESDQITIKCTCRPIFEQDVVVGRASQPTPRSSVYYRSSFYKLQEVACEISFDADPSSPERDLLQIQPRLFASQLSCIARDEDNTDQKANISVRYSTKAVSEVEGADSSNEIDDQLRTSLAYTVELDDFSMAETKEEFCSANAVGCTFRHFLPEEIVYAIDTIKEDAKTIVMALQDNGRFITGSRRVMRDLMLSQGITAILRDILIGIIDFDKVFSDEHSQGSLFGFEMGTLTIRSWHEKLRRLPPEHRIRVQQALRDREDLFDRIYAVMKSMPNDAKPYALIPMQPPRLIADASRYLDGFFASSLKYLGPLRDAPKPLYPLAPAADPQDVGLRGEHTASILELHKNKKIRYIPSSSFKSPVVDSQPITRTLEAAVTDWLQYLGVASSVQSRDQGKLGHELKVGLSNPDSMHDLTHVGVGVSQVLPILVMCLLADTDSTLVFEQPELHLHPKVQTLLGDFFLSMALCNKQCIVETHSEYFIDRLRFRIAAATSEKALTSLTKIYFVEKPSLKSAFREVVINEYGAISDWPEGFFDQSQQQAEDILRAAAMKRKASRMNRDA